MAEHELNKIVDDNGEVFNLRDSTKLGKTGDASNTTSTFTKASGDSSSITSGSKLSAIFTAISSFFASLKSLAFKDKVSTGDINDDAITAAKVKDNETLPVNITGSSRSCTGNAATATTATNYASSGGIATALAGKASSTHTHGSITNDGKIGSTANLAVVTGTSGAVTTADLTTASPTVPTGGTTTSLEFIDTVAQDSKGKISATKKAVPVDSTYSSTGTNPVNGKAIAAAIGGLDSNKTSTDGTNVQVKVTETDGKISAVNVTTDNTENKNNKVSKWQTTPDDSHFPSEKLVKDALDAKASLINSVAIFDGYVRRMNEDPGWRRVAYKQFNGTITNVNALFRLYLIGSNNYHVGLGNLLVNIRFNSSGSAPEFVTCYLMSHKSLGTSIKLKVVGVAGNAVVEVWFSPPKYSMLMLSCLGNGYDVMATTKDWTFERYLDATDSEPVEDTANHVYVFSGTVRSVQLNIASPTKDNLVAMDANGLVKDSGLAKSSVESAISKAGSAIQGVKVNGTTLTPDANKIVTVPLATKSADGAMSAADKTKLDGIATGAEANVQADWNITNSSSDAFIKNKPYYTKYTTTSTYYKVCSFPATSSDAVDISGIQILARYFMGGINGRLIYKNGFRLYYERVSDVYNNTQFVKFHYVTNGSKIDLYAQRNGYPTLHVAPLVNQPKSRVDFTDFGTEVPSLPEGATEITPVWVANSKLSSGTAPVKVNAFGDLTPVTMDSIPTASSTNLMTSGGIKTALDNAVANVNMRYPFGVRQNRTTSYGYRLFNVKFNTAQSTTNVRISGNIVVGTTGNNEHISFDLVIANVNTVENNPSSINLLTTSTRRGSRVVRLAYKRPSNWNDGLDVFILWNAEGTATAANYTYGWEITQQEATKPSGVEVKDENLTSALTGFTLDSPRTFAITEGTSAIGSTSVPVYANVNGVITPCTDDFVHDGDVTSTYSSTGTAPVNGTAVAAAIGGLDVSNITGFGTGKTLATLKEENGKISATFQDISITKSQVSDFSHTHGNIQNGGTLQTNDITIANGDKLVVTDSSDSSKVARASISFDGSTTTKALTPKGTFEAFAKSGDITTAIQALDVSSVGGDGKYISAISETDGKISATATTMDTTPTANSTKAVTSGGIKTALDGKASTSHAHDDRYIKASSGNKSLSFGGTTTLGTVLGNNVNLVMPEADSDIYYVSANVTSFSDVLDAYNAHKKLILQIGFKVSDTAAAAYNIPLNRIIFSGGIPSTFTWVYTQDRIQGDANRGAITTWSLGSSGWESHSEFTYYADTAGLSNKSSALIDFGNTNKMTRVGWEGDSIGKVIATGNSTSSSESSYLAAYYVADGMGHVKDVEAANVQVGSAKSVNADAGESISSTGTNGSMEILNGALTSSSGGGGSCSIDGDGISFTQGVTGSSMTASSISTAGTGTFTGGASAKGRPIDGSATILTNKSSIVWNASITHLVNNRSAGSTTIIDLKNLLEGVVYWLHVPRDNIIGLKNSSAISTFYCYDEAFTMNYTSDTYNIRSHIHASGAHSHGGFSTAIVRSNNNFYVMMDY